MRRIGNVRQTNQDSDGAIGYRQPLTSGRLLKSVAHHAAVEVLDQQHSCAARRWGHRCSGPAQTHGSRYGKCDHDQRLARLPTRQSMETLWR